MDIRCFNGYNFELAYKRDKLYCKYEQNKVADVTSVLSKTKTGGVLIEC